MERYEPNYLPEKKTVTLQYGAKDGDVYIGVCIYCGSTDNLSDEHTIPYGLWGRGQLLGGSCKTCATITSQIELKVLRNGLERAREFLDAPTRRSRTSGRWNGRVEIESESGHRLDVPIYAVAQFVLLPVFDYLPRKLLRDPKVKKHRSFSIRVCPLTKTQDPVASGYSGPAINVDPCAWARFLTKVAYSEYIRTIDNNFRSEKLTKFILENIGDPSSIVGGRVGAPEIDYIYNLSFCALANQEGKHTIVCYLRFFSFLESPSYLVVLKECRAGEDLPSALPVRSVWDRKSIWPNYPEKAHVPFL